MAREYATEAELWDAVQASVQGKLQPMRNDLLWLDPEARIAKLIDETLAEHWNDPIAAGYMWDRVARIVRAAVTG